MLAIPIPILTKNSVKLKDQIVNGTKKTKIKRRKTIQNQSEKEKPNSLGLVSSSDASGFVVFS